MQLSLMIQVGKSEKWIGELGVYQCCYNYMSNCNG